MGFAVVQEMIVSRSFTRSDGHNRLPPMKYLFI